MSHSNKWHLIDSACPGVTFPNAGTTAGTSATIDPAACGVAQETLFENERCFNLTTIDSGMITVDDCTACRSIFKAAITTCGSMVC